MIRRGVFQDDRGLGRDRFLTTDTVVIHLPVRVVTRLIRSKWERDIVATLLLRSCRVMLAILLLQEDLECIMISSCGSAASTGLMFIYLCL